MVGNGVPGENEEEKKTVVCHWCEQTPIPMAAPLRAVNLRSTKMMENGHPRCSYLNHSSTSLAVQNEIVAIWRVGIN